MSAHSLTSVVSIGSRSHDLVVDDFRILRMLPSDTGSKEDRAVLLLFGLVRETGTDDSDFRNFVTKQEESARERALCQLTECF